MTDSALPGPGAVPPRRARLAGAAFGLAFALAGLASLLARGTLGVPQGADAPAYVRIARTLASTGGLELPGPAEIDDAPQQRLDDPFGSPVSLAVDGRFLPKHPWAFGALLVPGVAAQAARVWGVVPALLAAAAVLLGSPAARNVLWGVNVDTAIALLWLASLVLAARGRPVSAGLLGGLVPFLRPTAAVLLGGLVVLAFLRPRRERLALFGVLAVLFAAFGTLNTLWWGAPWRTAYDRVAVLGPDGLSVASVADQFSLPPLEGLGILLPVSYTHLDVYKRQAYDRVAVLGPDGLSVASVADQFSLPPLEGLGILLLHPSGGLLATAPLCFFAVLGLAILPAARERVSACAMGSGLVAFLLLAPYRFLEVAPETAYRFAAPLVVASVLPLAALASEALSRFSSRGRPDGAS